jgi:hypothetical protein
MTHTTTVPQGQPRTARNDDDEPGGPSHPAPGHLPPEPEPAPEPEREGDEPGGPSHPAPGHVPPASPQTGPRRL